MRGRVVTRLTVSLLLAATSAGWAQDGGGREATGPLRVEWEHAATRSGRPIIRGYVYNRDNRRAENIRLRIEQLDDAAQPIHTTYRYVVGTLATHDRLYFEAPVPAPDRPYRVRVDWFDWWKCGNG
jgi:hypothetical protein